MLPEGTKIAWLKDKQCKSCYSDSTGLRNRLKISRPIPAASFRTTKESKLPTWVRKIVRLIKFVNLINKGENLMEITSRELNIVNIIAESC